jgi:spastin
MSYLNTFFDLLSSVFSSSDPPSSSPVSPPSSRSMEASPSASAVVSERVALKLKGYFELAKEQIDKAVRCEEWGLPDDAVAYYQNAQKVFQEAKAARVPDVISSRLVFRCIFISFVEFCLIGVELSLIILQSGIIAFNLVLIFYL